MIIAIVIAVVALIGKLVIDLRQHLSKKTIDHTLEAVIVFASLVMASFVWMDFKIIRWETAYVLTMLLVTFWALFDTGFGLLIARNPLFLGDSSALDRAQKRNPALVWFKYAMVPLSIILYVKLHV